MASWIGQKIIEQEKFQKSKKRIKTGGSNLI